jgi:hypothetical protein
MALGLKDWSPPGEVASVIDTTRQGAWEALEGDYSHIGGPPALGRIFEIAREHGVVCVVWEHRYIDADWRSQLARFFNGAFRRYPSVCHRLHFFTRAVPDDLGDLSGYQDAYRGYAVLRPLTLSPVSKTMIAPPPELEDAIRCECDETIELFGWPFTIRAMPFISQDTQFIRCAHAALWMVLRHAHFRHGLPLRLPADIHDAAVGGVIVGRQLPSDGLSGFQLSAAMNALGLSPTNKPLPETREDNRLREAMRLHAMLCRYINSSLPPIIISRDHAWVVSAYARRGTWENPMIRLWRHDDVRGPYLPVDDPWDPQEAEVQPWVTTYLPLLPKSFIDAERAEIVGIQAIDRFRRTAVYEGTTLAECDRREDERDQPTLRTYLAHSSQFKSELSARGMPDQLALAYRLTPMPRYVWVIEVVDRQRRSAGEPDVIGEVLLDATLTQFEPKSDASLMALHVDNFAQISGVDQGPDRRASLPRGEAYGTGCPPLAAALDRAAPPPAQ